MSKEQVCSVHLRNQHWYLSNWDDKGMYFTLGLPLPDDDGYNGSTSGRAPNKYKDVLIFTEYHTSSVKKKTQQMSRSTDLQSTYLQQLKWYPLPLIPLLLKTASQLCSLPQPLLPKYNTIPSLEEQACQEKDHLEEVEEACLEEEEAHLEEEEAHQEGWCQPTNHLTRWKTYGCTTSSF